MQKTKPTAHKYGSARSLPKRQSARRGVSCSAARKEPPQPAGPGLPPRSSRARGADSSVACSAGSCSSSLDLAGGKVSAAVSKPSSLNRAWLNHMVPKLVNTVNKSTHLSPPARRGEGAVTMAFVCNETFEEPLTRVLQETTQPAEEGGSFEDWNVIMEGVSAMDRMDTMAGVLVVKPLFDESALKCPSGRDRAATLLTQLCSLVVVEGSPHRRGSLEGVGVGGLPSAPGREEVVLERGRDLCDRIHVQIDDLDLCA